MSLVAVSWQWRVSPSFSVEKIDGVNKIFPTSDDSKFQDGDVLVQIDGVDVGSWSQRAIGNELAKSPVRVLKVRRKLVATAGVASPVPTPVVASRVPAPSLAPAAVQAPPAKVLTGSFADEFKPGRTYFGVVIDYHEDVMVVRDVSCSKSAFLAAKECLGLRGSFKDESITPCVTVVGFFSSMGGAAEGDVVCFKNLKPVSSRSFEIVEGTICGRVRKIPNSPNAFDVDDVSLWRSTGSDGQPVALDATVYRRAGAAAPAVVDAVSAFTSVGCFTPLAAVSRQSGSVTIAAVVVDVRFPRKTRYQFKSQLFVLDNSKPARKSSVFEVNVFHEDAKAFSPPAFGSVVVVRNAKVGEFNGKVTLTVKGSFDTFENATDAKADALDVRTSVERLFSWWKRVPESPEMAGKGRPEVELINTDFELSPRSLNQRLGQFADVRVTVKTLASKTAAARSAKSSLYKMRAIAEGGVELKLRTHCEYVANAWNALGLKAFARLQNVRVSGDGTEIWLNGYIEGRGSTILKLPEAPQRLRQRQRQTSTVSATVVDASHARLPVALLHGSQAQSNSVKVRARVTGIYPKGGAPTHLRIEDSSGCAQIKCGRDFLEDVKEMDFSTQQSKLEQLLGTVSDFIVEKTGKRRRTVDTRVRAT